MRSVKLVPQKVFANGRYVRRKLIVCPALVVKGSQLAPYKNWTISCEGRQKHTQLRNL